MEIKDVPGFPQIPGGAILVLHEDVKQCQATNVTTHKVKSLAYINPSGVLEIWELKRDEGSLLGDMKWFRTDCGAENSINPEEAAEDNLGPPTRVTINGNERLLSGEITTLSYGDIIRLAGMDIAAPDEVITVTYYTSGMEGTRGSLTPGSKVKVAPGLIINVART